MTTRTPRPITSEEIAGTKRLAEEKNPNKPFFTPICVIDLIAHIEKLERKIEKQAQEIKCLGESYNKVLNDAAPFLED